MKFPVLLMKITSSLRKSRGSRYRDGARLDQIPMGEAESGEVPADLEAAPCVSPDLPSADTCQILSLVSYHLLDYF